MQWIKQSLSRVTGQQAENRARQYLMEHGLLFHSSNYQCRTGEIDLIMKNGSEWVFVEVKYRKNTEHGHAAEYFHAAKRKKFTLAMKHFMHNHDLNPAMVAHRIDLVAIDGDDIQWYKSV
ncbi:YraN family protein [Aliiglaciecola sp. LCG003]|uniref:YraN family protein n=1 Tax=Aliiglaciecola sp. LCG003 TaxID=3053655 RepID=UPI0025743866|nr:YraN family protein [Aliiglaciecola sp. LCG003]WJG08699.1 YraN family protein [Aliiglaciecola sp. LCG003]